MPEIAAQPFPFPWQPGKLALVVIDMQRDFVEPGGFGDSLGNDVARLQAIVPTHPVKSCEVMLSKDGTALVNTIGVTSEAVNTFMSRSSRPLAVTIAIGGSSA